MAISIEGFSVVGLRSRIEQIYAGGVEGLTQTAPNSTPLADEELWRCSFMASADAESFVNQLKAAGFNADQGPDSDFVLVNEFDLSVEPYCEWLQVFQWQKGVIAWRSGTKPHKVVARKGWSPEEGSGLAFASPQNNNDLEFLRIDGNVSVYFDKRRGCEVFVGRTEPDPDEVYKAAARIVFEHSVVAGQPKLGGDAEGSVRKAVADLENLAERFPESWRIHFLIGKGSLALGNLDRSYSALSRAYQLEVETESVLRELAGVCLVLGHAEEAVQLGKKAAALKPDDSETLGNLACSYLVAGRLQEASTTINAALNLNGEDRTNLAIKNIIQQVIEGTRPQPRKLSDI